MAAEQTPDITAADTAPDTAENAAEAAENAAEAEAELTEEKKDAPEDAEKKAEEEKEPYTAKKLLNDVLDMLEAVVTAVFVVVMCFAYIFCTADVDGTSMLETLHHQDRLIVQRVCRLTNDFSTGDILILNSKTAWRYNSAGELESNPGLGKEIVKRLIAKGGQEVDIDFDNSIVYVDGQALDEPYTNAPTTKNNGAFTYPFTVPEGYVFVLGDNRLVSRDSRDPGVALVPVKDIVGKVVLRMLPFKDFGKVE